MQTPPNRQMLRTPQAAQYLGISASTLEHRAL